MKPGTSWIARGFWIISLFMVVAFVHTMLVAFTDTAATAGGQTLLRWLAGAGILLAVGTMAYTGILLGASKGITFWRSGAVPVVFVVSAVVTGHFAIMIGLVLFFPESVASSAMQVMAAEAAALVVVEVLAIAFFLQAAFRHPDPRESAVRLLRHHLFVVGYVVAGLALPFLFMLLLYRGMGGASQGALLATAGLGAVLGLIGGLILRRVVLMFGALPTLNLAGFEFRRVARPKDPKAGIGLLPPQ
jgi:formate-dependent nitrite reductase membrane component NrfD